MQAHIGDAPQALLNGKIAIEDVGGNKAGAIVALLSVRVDRDDRRAGIAKLFHNMTTYIPIGTGNSDCRHSDEHLPDKLNDTFTAERVAGGHKSYNSLLFSLRA